MMFGKNKLFSMLTTGAFLASAAAFSSPALAGDVKVNISSNDAMQFSTKEITVPANSNVTLTLDNKSSGMQHNWVLTTKGSADKVAAEGMSAGPGKSYVKKDAKVLAFTKLTDPKKKGTVSFKAPAKGTYDFVCTSPGHGVLMKGKFIVK